MCLRDPNALLHLVPLGLLLAWGCSPGADEPMAVPVSLQLLTPSPIELDRSSGSSFSVEWAFAGPEAVFYTVRSPGTDLTVLSGQSTSPSGNELRLATEHLDECQNDFALRVVGEGGSVDEEPFQVFLCPAVDCSHCPGLPLSPIEGTLETPCTNTNGDVYRIEATQGQRIEVEADTISDETATDLWVRVADAPPGEADQWFVDDDGEDCSFPPPCGEDLCPSFSTTAYVNGLHNYYVFVARTNFTCCADQLRAEYLLSVTVDGDHVPLDQRGDDVPQ